MEYDKKLYLLFNDYSIGYIKSICDCTSCKIRGEAEFFIHTINGKYKDCVKFNEINSFFEDEVLTVAESLEEIIIWIKEFIINKKDNEIKFIKEINILLHNSLIK